jgi:hypothetical protein
LQIRKIRSETIWFVVYLFPFSPLFLIFRLRKSSQINTMKDRTIQVNDAKEVFRKCGTCSQTFGHLLNREFGHRMEDEERALDPLAGGINNEGHQCGMLWGAALAVGAEAYRRHPDPGEAMAVAVTATQQLIDSFVEQTDTVNCREITGLRLNTSLGMARLMFRTLAKGMNNSPCFNLAESWAPQAVQAALEGLHENGHDNTHPCRNCAAEVVAKLGGSKEEQVLVAGFAGGMGLRGHACGALAAAIWKKNLDWLKANPGKTPPFFKNPAARDTLKRFKQCTNEEMLCDKISGQTFGSVKEHSDYLKVGGCADIIEELTRT